MGVVVVGVDGSDGAEAALRFAAEEAALRDARLRVVSVWQVPAGYFTRGLLPTDTLISPFEEHAKDLVAKALSQVVRLQPGVDREGRTPQGHAAEELVRQAEDADLLVVGSRGHGGFTSLLLGSVSQQCAQHAPCPVAVVPRSRTLQS